MKLIYKRKNTSFSVNRGIVIPIEINEGIAIFFNPSDSWINKPKNRDYRKGK